MLITRSLFYYRKPGDTNYLGRITLCDVFVDKTPTRGRKNTFKLEWPQFKAGEKRSSLQFNFTTETDEECDHWVNLLNENIFYSNNEAFHMRQHIQQTQHSALMSAVTSGLTAIGTSLNAFSTGINNGIGDIGRALSSPNTPQKEKFEMAQRNENSPKLENLPVLDFTTSHNDKLSPERSRAQRDSGVITSRNETSNNNNNNENNNDNSISNGRMKLLNAPEEQYNQTEVVVRKSSRSRAPASQLLYTYKVEPLPYFGVPLDVITSREGKDVPSLVTIAIKYITDKALREEGILRLSGSLAEVNEIRSQIERDGIIDFHGRDPHVVSNVLKAFLRELPEPLIPPEINSG